MKVNASKLFFVLISIFFTFNVQNIHAEFDQNINTGVLSNIWYSKIDINEGDNIKIYGAIQNHSNASFNGKAIYYIDGNEISKTDFISRPNTLVEISAPWKAVGGDHIVQLKIVDIDSLVSNASTTLTIDSLLSYKSNEVPLNVNKKEIPKPPLTAETIKKNATDTALKVVDSIDTLADDLAKNVESYKKPSNTGTNPDTSKSELASLLGDSKVAKSVTDFADKYPVFNIFLDAIIFLLHHWKISIFGMLFIFFAIRFFRRMND